MKHFACAHCQRDLGEYVEGQADPTCDDHPNGVVMVIESNDVQ